MLKRSFIGLLLFIFILLPQGSSAQESGSILKLDLAKTLELALAQNEDLALAQLNVEAKRMAFREAEAAADDLPADMVTTYPLAITKYVIPRTKAMELALAERNKELAERRIKLAAEQQFYSLLKAENEVALKEAALMRAKELLEQIEEKLHVGAAARVEVLAQEAAVAQAQAALEAARARAANAALDLKRTLNLAPEQEIKLVGDFKPPALEEMELNTIVEEALAISSAVLAAREGLAVADTTFQQAKKFYTPNVFVYRESKYNLEAARVNLAKTESEIRANVIKDYNLIKAAASGIAALAKGVEQAQEALRLARLRYEVGMATSLEVEQAADRLSEVETQLLAARYDYQILLSKFHYRLFDPISSQSIG